MKHNACIISFFMDNIDRKTVDYQKAIVQKYNKNNYPHYIMKTASPHGVSIDYFWTVNGVEVHTLANKGIKQKVDHDIVFMLDIDAIPLHEDAFDVYIEEAAKGKIIGNAQRTNHIQNNQHVFAAPSASAISRETFIKIGAPSALETARSDVLEEYTWNAEACGVSVDLVMPLRYDRPPMRYAWEDDTVPYWPLADGMPVCGLGTTYGRDGKDLFYHNFQIRMPGQEHFFWEKCESVLNG